MGRGAGARSSQTSCPYFFLLPLRLLQQKKMDHVRTPHTPAGSRASCTSDYEMSGSCASDGINALSYYVFLQREGLIVELCVSQERNYMLDVTTDWGKHADQRLHSNIIGWLTTVGSEGRPYTVPVWFLWDGQTILIFSQPHKQKVRNLRKNAHVTLALDDTKRGRTSLSLRATRSCSVTRI